MVDVIAALVVGSLLSIANTAESKDNTVKFPLMVPLIGWIGAIVFVGIVVVVLALEGLQGPRIDSMDDVFFCWQLLPAVRFLVW